MKTTFDIVHQMNQILKKIEKSKDVDRLKAKAEELFDKTATSSHQTKVNHLILQITDIQCRELEIRNILQNLRGAFTKENPNGDLL